MRLPDRRDLLFLLGAVIVSVAVVWGIPESVVRLSSPTLGRYTAILFGNDPASKDLFVRDPYLFWTLRPNVRLVFLGTTVRTSSLGFRGGELRPSARVVLCLGDSTPFGWRVEERDGYPWYLEELLRSRTSGAGFWQVVNAGVPGYSSFQVRLLAEHVLPVLRPDTVVLCVGNNDGWPAPESDAAVAEHRRTIARLEALARKSMFLTWIRDRVGSTVMPQTDHLASAVPRVGREEYISNVTDVVRRSLALGATVVVLGPPVNLHEHPARMNIVDHGAARVRWGQAIVGQIDMGRATEALGLVERRLESNPGDFYARWLQGVALAQLGRMAESRRALEEAFERHPFPEGLKPSYRAALASAAAETGAIYVDAVDLAFERYAAGATPQDLFIDWCHPSPAGHRLIAEAIVAALDASGRNGSPHKP